MMSNNPVTEVADKLRGSLNINPDSVNAGLRSPITPLQTRSSGLTSAATTTTSSSCTSSSSGTVKANGLAIPSSAAQSAGGSCSGNPKTATGNVRPSGKSTPAPLQQPIKIYPAGNLFPSGNVKITGMTQGDPISKTLGPGASFYGYGSVMRGISFSPSSSSKSKVLTPDAVTLWKTVLRSSNPEEAKRIGNDLYNNGCFTEALQLYDRAISLKPANAIYHSNRAAALSELGRIGEAVNAFEVATELDPNFVTAHHRLGALLFRLGQIDNAGRYFYMVKDPSDPTVEKKLQIAYNCIERCNDARRHGEWDKVLSEASEAMSSGADSSPELGMCKVEALLKLQRLDDARSLLAFVPKVEPFPASFSKTPFFDMACEAYVFFVKSQIELALGRFENAVTAAEKASEIHPGNIEVGALYKKVRMIARARDRGNNLYESERYSEASVAYTEGLAFDPSNAAMLYHRADCFFKVGNWESSIEDCDRALLILPSYTKPRLQRAASYCKLERWDKAVSDYEILRMGMPYDKEIAESLFKAQVVLKKSQGEEVLNMEFKGEVEEISSVEELKAVLARPGFSVVHFFKTSDKECKEMCDFMGALCIRYPSLHFLKVEIEKCRDVGEAENVKDVPTIKIYKDGSGIKEIVCPSKEALERSVRHYSL